MKNCFSAVWACYRGEIRRNVPATDSSAGRLKFKLIFH